MGSNNQILYGLHASLEELKNRYNKIITIIKWIDQETYNNFINNGLKINFDLLVEQNGFWSVVNTKNVTEKLFLHRFLVNKYNIQKKSIPKKAIKCSECLHQSLIINHMESVEISDCRICDYYTTTITVQHHNL